MSVSRDGLCDVFRCTKGIPPRSRYLVFHMLNEGFVDWDGRIWRGGIARLAASVGYSGGAVSSSLKKLTDLGFLAKGTAMTGGRPVITYGIGPKLKKRTKKALLDERVLQALGSREERFMALSVSERCMLAQLWLTLQSGGAHLAGLNKHKACILTGAGVVAIAKDAGVGKATAQRLLACLHQKSFILASTADFPGDGIAGITKAYFLLGPAMLGSSAEAYSWKVELDGMLGWLAGNVEGYDVNQLITEVYSGGANSERTESLATGLRCLSDPGRRSYVLVCLCAAVSNSFIWEAVFSSTSTLYHVEAALLRALKLQVTGPGSRHLGIENMAAEVFDRERDLHDFIMTWAGVLLDKVIAFFPRLPQREKKLVRPPSYVTCCLLEIDGVRTFQIGAVFFDISSSDKFRGKLRRWHEGFGMPMPEFMERETLVGCE